MILVVYLGHAIFHPAAVVYFFKSVFGRGLELSKLRNLRKKAVRLYRGTRQTLTLSLTQCNATTIVRRNPLRLVHRVRQPCRRKSGNLYCNRGQ